MAGVLRPPAAIAALLLLGAPLLAFLVIEQQLALASERWKRRVFLELPVLSEHLGMLLGAGYSLGAALNRLAAPGTGASAPHPVGGSVETGRPSDRDRRGQ